MPSVSFEQLGVWVVCALLALDVFLRVAAHLREQRAETEGKPTRVQPQPLIVQAHKEFVTKEEHARDFKLLHDDLTQSAVSRKRMHAEIGEIARAQAELRKENESQSRDLADVKREINTVNARIDEIPARTIRLLNETKQLHK